MESKLDHNKIQRSTDGDVLLTAYAFEKVHELLQDKNTEVTDLRLMLNGEDQVSERGFRNFLTRLVSINWDDKKLSVEERTTINEILVYLSVPMETEVETPVSGTGLSVEEAIAQQAAT